MDRFHLTNIELIFGIPGNSVDERCFMYFEQTAAGRERRQIPLSRVVCFRYVFPHEVQKPAPEGKGKRTIEGYAKYPLPHEGQRGDEAPGEYLPSDRYESKLREEDAKYWEKGWYYWASTNRWAAQEKVDLMAFDLALQEKRRLEIAKQKSNWEEENRGKPDMGHGPPPIYIKYRISDPS
jgi:hypothetical protein